MQKGNKLYFVASLPFGASTSTESTFHLGIWSFGRKTIHGNFALSLDFVEEGIDTANYKIVSFGAAGDFWFIAHSDDGSISKTNDVATYDFDSIYETQIWNPGGSSILKKLLGVTVNFAPLPSGATVTIKYKKDAETSFTLIGSETTADSLYLSKIVDGNGKGLPEFREIILRVEVKGAKAEITGVRAKADRVQDEIYG